MTIKFGWSGYTPYQWEYWYDYVSKNYPNKTPDEKMEESRSLLRKYKFENPLTPS